MKTNMFLVLIFFSLLPATENAYSLTTGSSAAEDKHSATHSDEEQEIVVLEKRPFQPMSDGYRGRGISYGPYRAGQRPGGREPSKEQLEEDLKILAGDGWQMIRTYGTEPFARTVCEIIRDENLKLNVMLGAWIAPEKGNATQRTANEGQVERAIAIAKEFPTIVSAVNVGNETQVFWSGHKVEQATLIRYVREVRSKIKQPVTVADDFMFWVKDESKAVAREIDFIVTHIYAMWNGKPLDQSLAFTREQYRKVRQQHPDHLVVIGEAGWATRKPRSGEQAERIKGVAGEKEQQTFFENFTEWLHSEKIGYFYFEAFDEPWKGGSDFKDAEKHWGLFFENRSRKQAARKMSSGEWTK